MSTLSTPMWAPPSTTTASGGRRRRSRAARSRWYRPPERSSSPTMPASCSLPTIVKLCPAKGRKDTVLSATLHGDATSIPAGNGRSVRRGLGALAAGDGPGGAAGRPAHRLAGRPQAGGAGPPPAAPPDRGPGHAVGRPGLGVGAAAVHHERAAALDGRRPRGGQRDHHAPRDEPHPAAVVGRPDRGRDHRHRQAPGPDRGQCRAVTADGRVVVDLCAIQSVDQRHRGIPRYVADLAFAVEAVAPSAVGTYTVNPDLALPDVAVSARPVAAGKLRRSDDVDWATVGLLHISPPLELSVPADRLLP